MRKFNKICLNLSLVRLVNSIVTITNQHMENLKNFHLEKKVAYEPSCDVCVEKKTEYSNENVCSSTKFLHNAASACNPCNGAHFCGYFSPIWSMFIRFFFCVCRISHLHGPENFMWNFNCKIWNSCLYDGALCKGAAFEWVRIPSPQKQTVKEIPKCLLVITNNNETA